MGRLAGRSAGRSGCGTIDSILGPEVSIEEGADRRF
jgi:hypothetical protein